MFTWEKALLVLHAISAGVLTGAAIHNGVLAWRRRRGSGGHGRLRRLYPSVMAVSWLLCFALGLVIYPTFRVEVRGAFLDAQAPWAVGLFEAKEHLAAMGLFALCYLVPTSRRLGNKRMEEDDPRLFDEAGIFVAGVVCFVTVVGLLVSSLRPV